MAYQALQNANRIYPHNYIVRRGYILNLSPRWGGSWQKISDFVNNQPLDSTINPKLGELAGYELFERGNLLYIKKEYQSALEIFDQSLQFGPNPVTLYYRGRSNYWLDKYSQAIDDFTKAIYLQPDVADYYYWRSKALYYFGRYTDGLADIERAYALNPLDEGIQKFRTLLLRKYEHPQLKGVDKNKARNLVNEQTPKYDEKAQYLKGYSHLALGENAAAEEVFRHLIVINFDNIDYARWLDFALFRQAKLEEIVQFWDDFIARNPESAEAYGARAGTYYHLEKYYKAIDSARIAERLGDKSAEEFIVRLTKLITRVENTE
ncbi:tetratricopeptide repeat protein [Gilvimarinus sp. 1_MG-2023]|uniref:tetratricopeptide repeat protein n=1 Tax=Gilvimarinus sp. 1_MG-2023 TaxID=3062638 RepID=UPI0026E24F2A|nr:tetratricopeptide repeat protein [Gilvimarinus sp. 1_MG-2023]MDO6746664.1 tetratricopeptide repeat protein [Gilvimarinus sp. 1_MG-2023]